jgi:trehalose 6-phosphate phosphatase
MHRVSGDEAHDARPHAFHRVAAWAAAWRESGALILLLDFDGTLAPIVERPELAEMLLASRGALGKLLARPDVQAAIVSGRGMADARGRAGIPGITYAGNHGMEIEGPGTQRIHKEATAARPRLEAVRDQVTRAVAGIDGAIVEDKGLTLSVHYRLVERGRVADVKSAVHDAVGDDSVLRVTEGKEVLEIRPRVEWDKGRAVEFLLDQLRPAPGTPIIYIGDDTTDEDAFRALLTRGEGEGVLVADPPPSRTAALSFLRDPYEVAELLDALVKSAPIAA